MSKTSTEQWVTFFDANGHKKTERRGSYVVVLTRIDNDDVQAWRLDGCRNKQEAIERLALSCEYPEHYRVKGAWKLYDSDFDAEAEGMTLKDYIPEEKEKRLDKLVGGIFNGGKN